MDSMNEPKNEPGKTGEMGRFSWELPNDLVVEVDELAEQDRRSRVREVEVLLREAVTARKAAK